MTDERERKRIQRVKRIRDWLNIDNIIDASVDLFLVLFDVLSSPILIVMPVSYTHLTLPTILLV